MKRMVLVALIVVAVLGPGGADAATTNVVRGGWLNDAPCLLPDPRASSVGPGTPPGSVNVTCSGTTFWNGGFTGRTVLKVVARVDTAGNMSGTADEWFYGVYTPTRTLGGLHLKHQFWVSGASGAFWANASIVGGTCGFAGSTGSGTFDGYQLNGGYKLTWTLPAPPGAPAACNPIVLP